MNIGKKRSLSHIKGEMGVDMLKQCFPKEWIMRTYTPDYGIDLSVELFSKFKDSFIAEGEHLFFQVKATEQLEKYTISINKICEVEECFGNQKISKIQVIKFSIDTALLETVEMMGSAVPVILSVADINTKDIYFICLNDYLEKVIIPKEANYMKQSTKTIYIPIKNKLNQDSGLEAIKWYAKRAKLYALFNRINYQSRELMYCSNKEIEFRIKHYIEILLRSNVWNASKCFYAMNLAKEKIDYYMEKGITPNADKIIRSRIKEGVDVDEEIYEATYCDGYVSFREAQRVQGLHRLWEQLTLMADIFEDVGKKAFMPICVGLDDGET